MRKHFSVDVLLRVLVDTKVSFEGLMTIDIKKYEFLIKRSIDYGISIAFPSERDQNYLSVSKRGGDCNHRKLTLHNMTFYKENSFCNASSRLLHSNCSFAVEGKKKYFHEQQ